MTGTLLILCASDFTRVLVIKFEMTVLQNFQNMDKVMFIMEKYPELLVKIEIRYIE